MAVIQSAWIVIAVSVFEIAQAFYPIRTPCLPSFPRQDSSCRDTIEDLKALLEITQALQPNQSYTCPSCSSTFSEEIILKLVNALIYTATQSCGSSNVGGGGGNSGGISGGSGNSGGLLGGLIGGGINPGIVIGGGNTGPVGGGSNSGGIPSNDHGRGVPISGGNTGMRSPSGNSRNGDSDGEGLIQLGLLDGQDTAHLDLAGQKLLGVDLGQQSGSGPGRGVPISGGNTGMRSPNVNSRNGGSNGEGLIQLGLLDGQDTAHLDLGGQKLLGVDLGQQSGSGGRAGGLVGGGSGGSNDGLINLGVLNGGNDLLDLGLGGKKLLGVDLGQTLGGVTGGLTGNNGGNNNPSGTGNPGATSQTSQPNYGNRMDYNSNTVPIANNNMNELTTPVNVETIVYNGGSQVPGNTGKPTDGYNGFEGMAKPVIGD